MKRIICMLLGGTVLCLVTACGTAIPNNAVPAQEPVPVPLQTVPYRAETAAVTELVTEQPTEAAEDWMLTLVNHDHPLPEHYTLKLVTLSNGRAVDERIYPDLQAMFDAARADGLHPMVREGYRTHDDQVAIMEEKVAEYSQQGFSEEEARQKAAELVAVPGTSEHELGLAVDINADGGTDAWPLYDWLAQNACQYGFILRYPQGKMDVTGIDYEPWHYRYVGKAAAQEIFEQQTTLEEYLHQN